jgi:hypothetical protein
MTFGRKTWERPARVFPKPIPPEQRRGTYTSSEVIAPIAKMDVCRHEGYRRLVAAMPCIACGCGPCQAAHPNTDKGMGMKTDDRLCFPLCGPQPGRPGCHALFDQGAMFTKAARRAIEPAWGADTRRRITANGLWPTNLTIWEEGEHP